MSMHQPYPIILERAIISRGILLDDTQDELIGFAWGENEVSELLSLGTNEAVYLVKTTPNEFISQLSEEDKNKAINANGYWFVSRKDEEIHVTFGSSINLLTETQETQILKKEIIQGKFTPQLDKRYTVV